MNENLNKKSVDLFNRIGLAAGNIDILSKDISDIWMQYDHLLDDFQEELKSLKKSKETKCDTCSNKDIQKKPITDRKDIKFLRAIYQKYGQEPAIGTTADFVKITNIPSSDVSSTIRSLSKAGFISMRTAKHACCDRENTRIINIYTLEVLQKGITLCELLNENENNNKH